METVICPHCGKEVELTQALRHEVEEKISKELKISQEQELSKIKKEIEETAEKKFREQSNLKEKDLLNQIEKLQKDKEQAESKELELLKKEREIDDKTRKLELDLQRQLNEEIGRVRKEEDQKAKLERLELEKKLTDTQKALEEAQRKTRQGSQQLQGEVLELDLEKQLSLTFSEDEILPVPKGVTGADVLQKVRNRAGKEAGIIIWETKRAKWNAAWISKLKEDMRSSGASEAILIVEELPEKLKNSGLVEGVWIASYKDALTLATTIRFLLMKVAAARTAAENKDEKLEELYLYITSDSFRHKIEGQIESFIQLKTDLEAEKRAMERIWSKREMQLSRLERNTANLFGDLQGIAGSALPPIKTLESGKEEGAESFPL